MTWDLMVSSLLTAKLTKRVRVKNRRAKNKNNKGCAKFTDDKVKEIREVYDNSFKRGETIKELMGQLGICRTALDRIVKRKTYRWVE